MIELLITISIIGILAGIIIMPLNNSRNRAHDASAKTTMGDMRVYANIFSENNGYSYASMCIDTEMIRLRTAVESETGGTITCNPSDSAYAVWVKLRSNQYFCVDSEGFAGEVGITEPLAGSTTCP